MKNNDILLEIPAGLEEAALPKFVADHVNHIRGALILTVYDARATVDDITVEDVEIEGDVVTVHYQYTWSSYSGCKDMQSGDTKWEAVSGCREGNVIRFGRYIEPERQAPNEEL